MIKIDLITGFLGSGKTTFIKLYARHLLDSGLKVGILVNDYGAVNVDMMLLRELEGERCGLETVAGACDADCHRRRFKTKLIALGMSGYDRVIVEPSGLFDVDEFFDALHESPLDRWYEPGSVICVADSSLEDGLSGNSLCLLGSQAATAGLVVLSKTQLAAPGDIERTVKILNRALEHVRCPRRIGSADLLEKPWNELDEDDYERIKNCGCRAESFVKLISDSRELYQTLYYMDTHASEAGLKNAAERLFGDSGFGRVFRIKGFISRDGKWYEINVTRSQFTARETAAGQDVVIVIGELLDSEKIRKEIKFE